jgi:hypothetical protein
VTKSHVKIQFTVYRVNQGAMLTDCIISADALNMFLEHLLVSSSQGNYGCEISSEF